VTYSIVLSSTSEFSQPPKILIIWDLMPDAIIYTYMKYGIDAIRITGEFD
jgi:hypothetical protein